MKVGDLVVVKRGSHAAKECFVEQIVSQGFGRKPGQKLVSLYGVDGEYVGDYWEDELVFHGGQVSDEALVSLIAIFRDKPGPLNDFVRVLREKRCSHPPMNENCIRIAR